MVSKMKYSNIVQATFLERPNRFVAYCLLNGQKEKVHVKNTGRCRELLTFGSVVWLTKSNRVGRKTAYDLVAVQKGNRLINIDSMAPNQVAAEFLPSLFSEKAVLYSEMSFANSRFDFYIEDGQRKIFCEVKGVTLEEDGRVFFPDAPTVRGKKHLEELVKAIEAGYEAMVLFVIQMKGVRSFSPHWQNDPDFSKALVFAQQKGVEILAYDCLVTENELKICDPVPFQLTS